MRDDHSWLALIETERRKRLALATPEFEKSPDPRALRDWWGTVSEIFGRMLLPSGDGPRPLPMDLLATLRDMARYLAVGQIPGPILDAATKGGTSPGPLEERHIRFAVTYRKAVIDGLIKDRSPNKTITTAFGQP